MSKKKSTLFIIFSIISLGIVLGIYYQFKPKTLPVPNNDVWVGAETVKEVSLPLEVRSIGTLVARSVKITPEVAGHVEKILFKDGAFVKKGEVLLQLDDALYLSKFQSAKAKLSLSENNFNRRRLLVKNHVITQQEMDEAESDLKEKRAEVKESELMLNKMKLIAPFDGRVGESKINRGDYINVGQEVVEITDTNDLRVEYHLPENYLSLLKLGQSVSITTAAYPDKLFKGKLSFIAPSISTDNRSIPLYATIENKDNLLAGGLSVTVKHSLGSDKKVMIIPARSVVPTFNGQEVYKIVDGKVYSTPILIGRRIKDDVQILQGLALHETVVTDGQLKLKNGMPVKLSAKKTSAPL